MNLLYIDGPIVKPTPEALQIDVFKAIWDRDESKGKEQALAEFTYIKFMCFAGKDNPYYGYPSEVRSDKIIERLGPDVDLDDNDPLLISAMAFYDRLVEESSPTRRFYDACVKGADKLIMFLQTVNFDDRDMKGSAVYKPNDINMVLKSANETLQSLYGMKERVEQELFESIKTRGNRMINYFEKPKDKR